MPCQIKVHLADGEIVETESLYPPGHSFPDRGLDRAPVVDKFKTITGNILGSDEQVRLIDALLTLRDAKSIAPVMAMVSSQAKH